MKKITQTLLLCTTLIIALTACDKLGLNKKDDDKVEPFHITVSDQMDSEELALAGEQLVGPATFMLADKTFDMSLAKDPENKRAKFYKVFLKRLMVLKGILKRVRPYARQWGDIDKLEKLVFEMPNSSLKTFLTTGEEDIVNLDQMQDVLVIYRNAASDFRKFLRDNSTLELTLNMNVALFSEYINTKGKWANCVIKETDDGYGGTKYDYECDRRELLTRKINAADVLAMSQAAAGEALYVTLFTSYSAQGAEELLKSNRNNQLPAPRVQAILESKPTFGKLRKDNSLNMFLELGADFSAAWKWAVRQQAQICPEGVQTLDSRKGFAFSDGLCVSSVKNHEQLLGLLDQALTGSGIIQGNLYVPDEWQNKTFNVNPFAWIKHPVQDLRVLAPTAYNECNHATQLKDKTMNGVFPDGNAETLLKTNCF